MIKVLTASLGVALSTALACGTAWAQAYPSAPLLVISPVQAGTAGDTTLRLVTQKMSENMRQAISVENMPGAAGMIGLDRLGRSKPDGYTVGGISDSTLTYVPIIQGRKNFDALEKLEPVSIIASSTWVLVTHPSVAARSVQELVALAKASPGKLNYASAGVGGSHHVVMEMFKAATDTQMVHVPYRGAAAALADVRAGQVQLMFSALSVALGAIKEGRLVALAVASTERSPLLPSTPTVAEAGVNGFSFSTWSGLLVPKGTSKSVVDRLNVELAKALADPAVAGRLQSLGATPQASSPEKLAELIGTTSRKMAKVIEDARISAE